MACSCVAVDRSLLEDEKEEREEEKEERETGGEHEQQQIIHIHYSNTNRITIIHYKLF
jgi:hypothetical protein